MVLVDTHCHLDVADFDIDRDSIVERCDVLGISRIIVPAVDFAGWHNLLAICGRYNGLYPALGLHPVYINQHLEEHLKQLETQIAISQPVAVGEIGLDFFVKELDRERQLVFFEAQLTIARDANLPVLLHVRKAHDQVLMALKKIRVKGGIAHAFNGSEQQAKQYIELGFKLGFGGTMTYAGSKHIHRLAKALPLESIVLETDAPDMVVEQHRGERNSPEYLPDCLAALATLRELPEAEIARQTTNNACDILQLN